MAIGVQHGPLARAGGRVDSARPPAGFQRVGFFKAYCLVVGLSGLTVVGIFRPFGMDRCILRGGVGCLTVMR
ncbi:hypothetical protein DENIT_40057 [Pseudomonas veronii]|nr:hypothetical protein DENIT_40057 [Pseudomonas veronii]